MACACGGSSRRAETPEADSLDERERQAIEAAKPASPYVTVRKGGYRATERCGQAHRIEVKPMSARFSETVRVTACSPRAISGNYKLTTTYARGRDSTTERAFGERRDNGACVASAAERAAASTGTVDAGGATPGTGAVGAGETAGTSAAGAGGATASTKGGKRGKRGKRGSGKPTSAPAVAPAPAPAGPDLLVATAVPTACTMTEHVIDHTWISDDRVPLEAGAKLTIDLWSDAPNDLEGVVFIVEQLAVPADMTPERWAAYRAADKAYWDRMRAYVERRVAAGSLHYVDNSVKAPPVPAKRREIVPPKPSLNASWVPGYWHLEGSAYHWSAGFWRVPESDIQKELTVTAPVPPPVAPPPAAAVAPAPPEPTPAPTTAPASTPVVAAPAPTPAVTASVAVAAPVAVAPPARPAPTAVWAPGAWQWDGRAWVWIDGAWRIPPTPQHTWRPNAWIKVRGGVRLSPGGWTLRIGR